MTTATALLIAAGIGLCLTWLYFLSSQCSMLLKQQEEWLVQLDQRLQDLERHQ